MIHFFPTRAVALSLGPLSIHWYGVMYALAFLIGMAMLPRLLRIVRLEMTAKDRENLLLAVFLGVLIGGRLGFVLFYGGGYYLEHPLQIFAVWEGGMSSHGGFLGVALALLVFCRRNDIEFLRLSDAIVVPMAIGLGLGRIGNFINQELYGTVTTLPWGMSFPGADGLRHPIQLYDFAIQMCIALCCFVVLRKGAVPGRVAGLFLTLYAVARFLLEYIREQNGVFFGPFSEGQLLTIPIFIAGVLLARSPSRSRESVRPSPSS